MPLTNSKQLHEATTRHYTDFVEANRELSKKTDTWQATCNDMTVGVIFVYEQLACTLIFEDGTKVYFDGQAPSIGLGATGAGSGTATFNVSPQELLDLNKVSFRASSASVVVGGIEVRWYKHKTIGTGEYLGSGIFGGLGIGGGISLGGSGNFTS